MSLIHVCNTFFEAELENSSNRSLAEWMACHPVVLQLQFLPLLYAGPEDQIAVSELPKDPDPRLCLRASCGQVEHWGPSLAIDKWAKSHGLPYELPDWEKVRRVNSKIYSFIESPKLPGAALLKTEKEVAEWIAGTAGPKVLKTAFGTAGQGHFHVGEEKNLHGFLQRQFGQKLPVVGEPWVERILDFSTQWKEGRLLGATVFENEPNGTYRSTLAGPEKKIFGKFLWALEEHLAIAKPLIEQLDYEGNLGIDAYVYLWEGKWRVQPVVEINGRKTMSWVALQIQQTKFPGTTLRLSYSAGTEGLLPKELGSVSFKRQIWYG